jgi:ubiquitin-like protein Pup
MPTRDGGGQQHVNRSGQNQSAEDVEVEETDAKTDDLQERHEQLDEDVDAILDEIDEVLETNAAEFVQGFVQKGGQ